MPSRSTYPREGSVNIIPKRGPVSAGKRSDLPYLVLRADAFYQLGQVLFESFRVRFVRLRNLFQEGLFGAIHENDGRLHRDPADGDETFFKYSR